MTGNVLSIPQDSLKTKREAVKLLAQDASPDPLLEAIRRLADALIDIDLVEVLTLCAKNADEKLDAEKLLNETIGILAGGEADACYDNETRLREALKLLAQQATWGQLYAALLAFIATPERLDAAVEAYTEDDEPDDDVEPLRAVG